MTLLKILAVAWIATGVVYVAKMAAEALAEHLEISVPALLKWTLVGLLFCSVLGPLSWPYFAVRDDAHHHSQDEEIS